MHDGRSFPPARSARLRAARLWPLAVIVLLIAAEPLTAQNENEAESKPPTPRLEGNWIQLVGQPQLEKWASPDVEPVDFTVFRADDGRWQLISCIRKTTHPGAGRLLYRWSSDDLTREGWKGEGIFLASKEEWDHAEGRVQAPFHIKDGKTHYLMYNSRGGHLMTSADGIDFKPVGKKAVLNMGRDVCLLDDRNRSGKWIAYYTSPERGINPATKDHTIRARTAEKLEGPWSAEAVEIPPVTPPAKGYEFVCAESPTVIRRGAWYYRFEQLHVFASKDPLKWEGKTITSLEPRDPLKRLAPEIVTHEGKDYIVAYQWRGKDPRGVFLARVVWE